MRKAWWWIFLTLVVCLGAAQAGSGIAVDVGHGTVDRGAISARGRSEFDFNRVLAGRLSAALQAQAVPVVEVNFDGALRELAERPRRAAPAAFFISIHHDSIGEAYLQPWEWEGTAQTYTDAKRGFGIFISRQNPFPVESLRCASLLGQHLRLAGFEPSAWHAFKHQAGDAENGVWYYDNLVVLYRTELPSVLFEAGVIKHRDEELALLDPERQQHMAETLAGALAECLMTREKPAPGSDQLQIAD